MNITDGKNVIIMALVFSDVTKKLTTKPIKNDKAINRIIITLPIPALPKCMKVEKARTIFKSAYSDSLRLDHHLMGKIAS